MACCLTRQLLVCGLGLTFRSNRLFGIQTLQRKGDDGKPLDVLHVPVAQGEDAALRNVAAHLRAEEEDTGSANRFKSLILRYATRQIPDVIADTQLAADRR